MHEGDDDPADPHRRPGQRQLEAVADVHPPGAELLAVLTGDFTDGFVAPDVERIGHMSKDVERPGKGNGGENSNANQMGPPSPDAAALGKMERGEREKHGDEDDGTFGEGAE